MLKEKENPNDEREKIIQKGKISTSRGSPNVKVNLNDEEENLIGEGGNPNDEKDENPNDMGGLQVFERGLLIG